jgi:hydrogenase/urease accessory protein HupE
MINGVLLAIFAVMAIFIPINTVQAHALQPGYLEMNVISTNQYAVLWKVPTVNGRPMAISAILPQTCSPRRGSEGQWYGTAFISRWIANCPGGLANGTLRIEGLERTSTDVLARISDGENGSETVRFTPSEPAAILTGYPSLWQVASTYFTLGVEHILSGLDHLLFVTALLLLVSGWRRLVGAITAFTVAHSITLTASTIGVISVPVVPIEAIITLSIAFVAAEILNVRHGRYSLTRERPWLIAFGFGLIHGIGFASALSEVGLPQNSVTSALLFFNLGIEIGQLLFIAVALAAGVIIRKITENLEMQTDLLIRTLPTYLIGCIAAFWTIERIAAF